MRFESFKAFCTSGIASLPLDQVVAVRRQHTTGPVRSRRCAMLFGVQELHPWPPDQYRPMPRPHRTELDVWIAQRILQFRNRILGGWTNLPQCPGGCGSDLIVLVAQSFPQVGHGILAAGPNDLQLWLAIPLLNGPGLFVQSLP